MSIFNFDRIDLIFNISFLVVRDENYLNILRQICFSLFVPEWRPFAQAPLGGQQKGQVDLYYNSQQQNNKVIPDLSKSLNAGQAETKWISLQTPGIRGRGGLM